MSNLLLDERLLSWVFLPIIFISTMITLLRMYYTKYKIISTMRPPIKKFKRADARDEVIRFKCEQLVMKSSLLTEEAFNARRGFLCKPEVGFLVKEGNREPLSAEANMAAMQSGMMDGMLGNLLTPLLTLPMIFMVNYFFDGLVVAQTPFSLTQQFKGMTQTGIFMENLDASYVSGMFFYLLMVFGLQKAIFLFMSD